MDQNTAAHKTITWRHPVVLCIIAVAVVLLFAAELKNGTLPSLIWQTDGSQPLSPAPISETVSPGHELRLRSQLRQISVAPDEWRILVTFTDERGEIEDRVVAVGDVGERMEVELLHIYEIFLTRLPEGDVKVEWPEGFSVVSPPS